MTSPSDLGRRVYKAHIHERFSTEKGISVFCHYGHLTPCGEWVDGGSVRWPRTPDWCDSEAEAEARLAPRIAEIGARLIRQADELLKLSGDPARSGDAAGIAQPEVAT